MSDRDTMRTVDHTHPETDQAFGHVYRRGPAVADGDGRGPMMRDVDHTPPNGDHVDLWARGAGESENEGRADE